MSDSRFMLRYLLRILVILLLSAPVVLLLLALQTGPAVTPAQALLPAETSRIEQLIIANAPPDMARSNLQKVSLSSEELNLLFRYALEMLDLQDEVGGRISLENRQVDARFSIPLRGPGWLNLGARFDSDSDQLVLTALQLGLVQIPTGLVEQLLFLIRDGYLVDNPAYNDLRELVASVQSLSVENDRLELTLLWEPALIARISDQARYFLVSPEDQQRILHHYQLLEQVVAAIPETTRAISLNTLLAPLFAEALQRGDGDTAIDENRTLLMTLAMYVNGEDIELLLGPDLTAELPRARLIEVRVQRRLDLAQHIISTAALTASAGAGLAQIVSNTKEAYDARYRTGYSFSDLTANTAGVALGKAATDSAYSARLIQERLAALTNESDYLPIVGDNRDGIPETDFNALYRDNLAEYQRRVNEIENLVYARPLFTGLQ